MRIAFVVGSAAMGGTERNVLRLAGALRARDLSVKVVFLSGSGPLLPAFEARRIPVIQVGWTYRARAFPEELLRLTDALCGCRPDLVHSYGYPTIWWGTLAALRGTPSARVIAIQALDTWKGRVEELLDRAVAPAIHLAVADSEGARKFALQQQRLSPERTRTVYDGIEQEDILPQRPPAETRALLGISADQAAIGMVARLHDAHKGQSVLLKAAPRILEARPAAVFVLVGDGADRSALETLAIKLRIADRVRFAGTRADLGDVLAALDVLVIPSLRFESVPKILVEGMAAGRPIVAARAGDIPELLEDGRTGYLVPPGDPAALAEALLECLADRGVAAAMGAAAREVIEQRGLTLEATADSIRRLYEDLLQGDRLPPPPGTQSRISCAAWMYLAKVALRSRWRRLHRREERKR